MAEKKNKPEIRFKGFTDEWEERELGELFGITSASRVHKNEWTESGVPFFRSSDVVADYKGAENNKAFISFELFEELSNKSGCVQKNDLLVTGGGSIGIPYLVKTNEPFYFKDADLLWLKNTNNINGYFIYAFFSTLIYRDYVNSITHIGTISHYTIEQAKSTPIKVPEKEENDKIGEYLTNLDHLITLHHRKYNKLVTIKKSMLEKMFPQNGAVVPEIRFKGFTRDWEVRKLAELGVIVTGSTPSTQEPLYYSDDGKPWVTPTDISENITFHSAKHLTEEGQRIARIVPKNTILVTCIASIGKNTMLGTSGSFNQQINGLVPKEKENYPYFLFTQSALWSYKMKRSAASGIMQIVNKTEFSELKTIVPTLAEQNQIGKYFKHLDTLITLQQRELEKLKNIKKACLEKMFV